jgi:hypothetical protein
MAECPLLALSGYANRSRESLHSGVKWTSHLEGATEQKSLDVSIKLQRQMVAPQSQDGAGGHRLQRDKSAYELNELK